MVPGVRECHQTPGEKKFSVAFLLWLVFGPLGIHHFYLGRGRHGLVWMLTMGFFLLGWLADLLSLYDYVRGANSNKEYVALCRIKRLLYTFWTHPLLVLVRIFAEVIMGMVLGLIVILTFPQEFDSRGIRLISSFAVTLGVCLVADMDYQPSEVTMTQCAMSLVTSCICALLLPISLSILSTLGLCVFSSTVCVTLHEYWYKTSIRSRYRIQNGRQVPRPDFPSTSKTSTWIWIIISLCCRCLCDFLFQDMDRDIILMTWYGHDIRLFDVAESITKILNPHAWWPVYIYQLMSFQNFEMLCIKFSMSQMVSQAGSFESITFDRGTMFYPLFILVFRILTQLIIGKTFVFLAESTFPKKFEGNHMNIYTSVLFIFISCKLEGGDKPALIGTYIAFFSLYFLGSPCENLPLTNKRLIKHSTVSSILFILLESISDDNIKPWIQFIVLFWCAVSNFLMMVVTTESKYQARNGEEGLVDDCDTETTNDSQYTHTDGEATTGDQRQADDNRENPLLEDSDTEAATVLATTGDQHQADDNRENPLLEDSDIGAATGEATTGDQRRADDNRENPLTQEEARRILGLYSEQEPNVIKTAYHRLVQQQVQHIRGSPAAKRRAEERMKIINRAYKTLLP